ncbi:MAG: hypothetical protein OEY94_04050 [Alphaproteobacteria bacterium]|nr:hypothetical protein [Alphaproteobacteria bacterium]
MTELTAEKTLETLDKLGIKTVVPDQPVTLVCGVMGNPSGSILQAQSPEHDVPLNIGNTFKGPDFT